MSSIQTLGGAVVVGIFSDTPCPIGIVYQYDDDSVSTMMFTLQEAQLLVNEVLAAIEKAKEKG